MKKIFWLLVIIFVLYVILIFKAPIFADNIEKLMHNSTIFNEKVRQIKKKLDKLWTKLPTKEDLQKTYSWTIETINKTKENIDNLRKKAKELEKNYDEVKQKIDEAQKTLDKVEKIWNNIREIINTTWSVN